ncbi:hypothetical protein DBV15_00617 [Temnothorax longispinosus]|uniref:Uncharacterized protein n=1 Tax=Temnothorax longispinosus TaxID=300112 RepID=A0A4S2KSR9_9HYME|nr:hypothetical protein DBV15_00617 [Temnothorax longispinosus]
MICTLAIMEEKKGGEKRRARSVKRRQIESATPRRGHSATTEQKDASHSAFSARVTHLRISLAALFDVADPRKHSPEAFAPITSDFRDWQELNLLRVRRSTKRASMQTTRDATVAEREEWRKNEKRRKKENAKAHIVAEFPLLPDVTVTRVLAFCFGGFDTNILKTPFVASRRKAGQKKFATVKRAALSLTPHSVRFSLLPLGVASTRARGDARVNGVYGRPPTPVYSLRTVVCTHGETAQKGASNELLGRCARVAARLDGRSHSEILLEREVHVRRGNVQRVSAGSVRSADPTLSCAPRFLFALHGRGADSNRTARDPLWKWRSALWDFSLIAKVNSNASAVARQVSIFYPESIPLRTSYNWENPSRGEITPLDNNAHSPRNKASPLKARQMHFTRESGSRVTRIKVLLHAGGASDRRSKKVVERDDWARRRRRGAYSAPLIISERAPRHRTDNSQQWADRIGARRSERRVGRSGDARAETREGQFDVNRSIVIRVNRLPLFVDGPRRPAEHNSRFVLLYFIPRVVEECRCCDGLQVSMVAYYEKLYNCRVTDDKTGNLGPPRGRN